MSKKPNAPEDQAIIAYAHIDATYKASESARKLARKEIDTILGARIVAAPMGSSVVYDSTFCVLTAEKKASGATLDKAVLINKLVTSYNFTVQEAQGLIDECSKDRAPQVILRAMEKSQ